MSGLITIQLNQLRFFAYHGLYAEEQKTGNEFEVNVAAEYETDSEVVHEIESTINYAAVYELVKKRMHKTTNLLETLVMEIAADIQISFPPIKKIKVSIKKLYPPIDQFSGNVEVVFSKDY